MSLLQRLRVNLGLAVACVQVLYRHIRTAFGEIRFMLLVAKYLNRQIDAGIAADKIFKLQGGTVPSPTEEEILAKITTGTAPITAASYTAAKVVN